ncbi:uncharacterized protein KGF55_003448 [Candida pseudojiufengensis]|uniref:uncharacterized protein n=1 Tax=Candida pseudojiufengensis TaxID=497109 RepID=UPI0022255902|nr:uncharacterized protein KGF55_003448 [Candida pseudojiufengensis]KAI5962372.1 hypothetical protein KGF55_003448 [Candida pseudojiufengensis]
MIDPRDEKINDEDLLSEDSSDELKDLQKEFELRYKAIKLKEAEKKKQKAVNLQPEVPKSPTKPKPRENGETRRTIQEDTQIIKSTKPPPSSQFLSQLHEANLNKTVEKYSSIDYNKRKFEFDFTNLNSNPEDVNEVCSLSNYQLRKRYFPEHEITNLLKEIPELKILKIEKLLAKTNKTNNYTEPIYTNWCLIGFIKTKTQVLYTKNDKKYMKFKIGSFNNDIEFVLFDEAFEKNWKLQESDLVLLLNPIINKYEIKINENESKTGFNLKLDSTNINSILEIGSIKDFGKCQFIKKSDNQRCSNVVDITKSKLCEIHLDMKFRSSSRMELNSISMRSPTKTKMYKNNKNNQIYLKEFNENSTYSSSGYGKIDSKKFQDPKILQTQLKKRKLINERANLNLETKLSKLSPNNSLLDKLNIQNHSKAQVKSTFSSSMISKIGFDPTNKNQKSISNNLENIKELYQLSSSTKESKSLKPSIEDKQIKIAKWKQNLKKFNETKQNSL